MAKSADKRVEQLQREWAKDIAARAEEEFLYRAERIRARCESPIEEILGLALYYEMRNHFDEADRDEGGVHWLTSEYVYPNKLSIPFDGVFCYQQAVIGNYRADFLFVVRDEYKRLLKYIVVECDGHDFHERTKEQATKDKARDRRMVGADVLVLRFTGSEIWRDPLTAAHEVCSLLCDIFYSRKRSL